VIFKAKAGWQLVCLSYSQYSQPERRSQKTNVEKDNLGTASKTVFFSNSCHAIYIFI